MGNTTILPCDIELELENERADRESLMDMHEEMHYWQGEAEAYAYTDDADELAEIADEAANDFWATYELLERRA